MNQTPSAVNAAGKIYNGIFFFGQYRKITIGISQAGSAMTRTMAGILVWLLVLHGLISCGNSPHFYRDLNAQARLAYRQSGSDQTGSDHHATPTPPPPPAPTLTQKRLSEDETYQRLIWEMNHPTK